MAETSFSKITVDNANRKASRFNMSHSATLSMGFGEVFPIHCQKMIPDSKHTCSTRAVLRLSPMVAPTTQGSITCKQWHSFVGLSDLFRDGGAFLSAQPRATAVGTAVMPRLPYCSHAFLSAFCLVGAKFTPYIVDVERHTYTQLTNTNMISNWVDAFNTASADWSATWATTSPNALATSRFPDYAAVGTNWWFNPKLFRIDFDALIPCGNVAVAPGNFFNLNPVNIDACDYVFETEITLEDPHTTVAFAVQLSSFGKRLVNIFEALGYGVDFFDLDAVDLTRLFAYFIAYYGSFGLSLYTNYESTACAEFLRGYENGRNNYTGLSTHASTGSFGHSYGLNDVFFRFINELADCYVTEPVDYIASFRKKDVSGTDDSGFLLNIVTADGIDPSLGAAPNEPSQNEPSFVDYQTGSIFINKVQHTQVDAELLKLLYKSVNRQTVAGRRIAELLRAGGYGDYVDEQKSHFLGYTEFNVDVSDVNATADGVNTVTGKQSNLGEYVGKGFGSSKSDKKFSYETKEFGYWITLCAVVPESSYVQGSDTTVYDFEREQQYNLEYDAMGYESEDKRVVKVGADHMTPRLFAEGSDSRRTFGLTARYMRYKVGRSFVAGNFKLRSRRDAYLPFILCRWIDSDDIHALTAPEITDDGVVYTMHSSAYLKDLPIAGNAWRYVNAYPWLANFDRIFAFNNPQPYYLDVGSILARWKYCSLNEDFFMLFARIQHTCWAKMLPIEDSWSTTDENDGKGTSMSVA